MPGLIAPIAERAQQREKQVDVDEVEIEGECAHDPATAILPTA